MTLLLNLFRFVEKSILSIPNARKWTSFEWQEQLYIVIACNTKGDKSFSFIYKMEFDEIQLFQKLDTETAFGVDSIIIGNDLFLTFANIYGKESDVFKWKAGKFVKDHTIAATGTDVDAFSIGGQHFVSIVGKSIYHIHKSFFHSLVLPSIGYQTKYFTLI